MSDSLRQLAEDFATELDTLFQGCLQEPIEFGVINTDLPDMLRIGPLPLRDGSTQFSLVPLQTWGTGDKILLALKVVFRVILDPDEPSLSVHDSAFGLWIRPGDSTKPRPVFRIEYNRDAHSKPAAHVHLHAESSDWGWIYGKAGLPMQRIQEIHFPVGGRRYRPTVEDLLTFLNREKIFNDWKPGWEQAIAASRSLWEERQLCSAVKADAETAVGQLQRMGYRVTPPSAAHDPAD